MAKEITTANKYRINPNKPLVVIITITAIIAIILVLAMVVPTVLSLILY